MFFPEIHDIYFEKTKEYMKEVLESYSIGNYRAATVLLYSVVICDIMLKLQELIDMYNDTVAKEILSDINKIREDPALSKSKWEKELLDRVHKRTDLLNDYSYINLCHLFDHRNFCAHPALNEDFELFSPNQEVVIAHIRNVITDILVKPPIFIKNIIEFFSNDLDKKKEIYINDKSSLKTYLDNRYYSKMSISMVKKVFKALWKFCFYIDNEEHCIDNRKINRYAISILYEENKKELLAYIKQENDNFLISTDPKCIRQFLIFLAENCEIYSVVSSEIKHQISEEINHDDNTKAISWFLSQSLQDHLKKLGEDNSIDIECECIKYIENKYEEHGLHSGLLDFFIVYFGNSYLFDIANKRYNEVIKPHLSDFTKEQFISLITVINNNDQIYNRRSNEICNTEIVRYAKKVLLDFDYEHYSNFAFDKDVLVDDDEADDMQESDSLF